MDKLNIQTIGGIEVPLKCDNYVLAQLQEKYEVLNNFEMKILGVTPLKMGGVIQKNDEGEMLFLKSEPSIRAICDALPLMIEEGYAYAKDIGKEMKPINLKLFMKELIMDHAKLATIIHDEFKRSIAVKEVKKKDSPDEFE